MFQMFYHNRAFRLMQSTAEYSSKRARQEEAYCELSQNYMVKQFTKIVNSQKPLTVFAKCSIDCDVYASGRY